jgi:hypothetical protein
MVSGSTFMFVVEVILIAIMGMLQRRCELRAPVAAH